MREKSRLMQALTVATVMIRAEDFLRASGVPNPDLGPRPSEQGPPASLSMVDRQRKVIENAPMNRAMPGPGENKA